MPYTTPTTRSTGLLVTASIWNTDLVNNILFLADPPACRVYNSSNISCADAAVTTLTFNSERFDTDNMHSTVSQTSRITFNTAGVYVVTFNAECQSGNDYSAWFCDFFLNGATTIANVRFKPNTDALYNHNLHLSTLYKFAAADYIEVRVFQDNTANTARNVLAAGNYSPEFSAHWIGQG